MIRLTPLALLILLCMTQLTAVVTAKNQGITVDSTGHPIFKSVGKALNLKEQTPRLDVEQHKPLQGKIADWSLFDLGIEYDEKPTPPPPKILIKRIRLGTWASRAGLEAGDLILKVQVKPDAYLITIDRGGKVYRARLSKLESTKLAATTQQAPIKTGVEKPHNESSIMTHIEHGDKITTEINLALCMPEPTDSFGKGQWELLGRERGGTLKDPWNDWLTALRASTNNSWPPRIKGYGWADLHVVMRSGQVVDISLLHNTPSDDFAEQAITYARSMRAPYPGGSQVSEIHLEVKFRREIAK
ncbi:MAG TPA: PDZ domain-containing protein [Candidatus Obscuribacterales bacterium]